MVKIETYSLKNNNGLELELSSLGATILGLKVPDKNGNKINVIVGLQSAENYLSNEYLKTGLYLGAVVGRYAGRISKGQVTIDSKAYPIHHNDGVHLHGGLEGFDKKIWVASSIEEGKSPSITLFYFSKHLEEGYPGNLKVYVTYQLTKENALIITYKATTDQTTIVNLTNHSYFNLNGNDSILDHELLLNSDFYLDVDNKLIPTGKIISIKKTNFDFNAKSTIGRPNFKGFDDTFILKEGEVKAVLGSKKSGISVTVKTNQPAIVIYTPLKFPKLNYKDDAHYSNFPAICFETQNFPDSPNNNHFPSTILKPEQTYINQTKFEFSII